MNVDREFRRQVADNLAAFMRGENTNGAYWERGVELHKAHPDSADKAARRMCLMMLWADGTAEHRISVGKGIWNELLRDLAFLESSLVEASQEAIPGRPVRLWVRLLAGLFPAVTTFIYWAIRGWDWGIAAVGWLSFAPIAFLTHVQARDDGRMPTESYSPFKDEAQWIEHQPLLHRFDLPKYDASVHHKPVKCGRTWLQLGYQVVITAPVVILMVGFLIVFWPLLLSPAPKRPPTA